MKRWHMELIPQAKTIKKNNVIFTTPRFTDCRKNSKFPCAYFHRQEQDYKKTKYPCVL